MSQAKVDKYKKEKYNRKHNKKKGKAKKIFARVAVALVAIAFIIYLGYSLAVSTGLYTPPTSPVTMSKTELESLRQQLIQQNDPNVQGVETTATMDTATVPSTENTTASAVENTTAAK